MSAQLDQNSSLLTLFEAHREFTRVLIHVYILVDRYHIVLKFNSAFCQIIDLKAIDVKKVAKLDDMLKINTTANNSPVIEQLLMSSAPMRIDEVNATSIASQQSLTLILSSYPYLDEHGGIL